MLDDASCLLFFYGYHKISSNFILKCSKKTFKQNMCISIFFYFPEIWKNISRLAKEKYILLSSPRNILKYS